jgi:zinc protease
MKTLGGLCLGVLLATSPLLAQAPAQPAETKAAESKPAEALPSVDQILEKYEKAIGGKEASEKINTRVMKGTLEVTNFGATGTLEIYSKAPNKSLTFMEVQGYGVVQFGFNGSKGWAEDPQAGLTDMTDDMVTSTKREADLMHSFKLKQLYTKMVVKEKKKIADQDVYVVEATQPEGPPDLFYFSAANGLLLRTDAERNSPQGKNMVESTMEDYRDVDGVKLPFTMKQDMPNVNILIKITEIKHNVPVEDAKFEKPVQK